MGTSTPRCRPKEMGNHVPVSGHDGKNHGDVDWEAGVKVDKRRVHRYHHEGGHDEFIHIHTLISRKCMTHNVKRSRASGAIFGVFLFTGTSDLRPPSSLNHNPDLHTTSRTANHGSAGTRPLRHLQPTISGNHLRHYRLHRFLIATGGATIICAEYDIWSDTTRFPRTFNGCETWDMCERAISACDALKIRKQIVAVGRSKRKSSSRIRQ